MISSPKPDAQLAKGGPCLNLAHFSMQFCNPGDPKGGPWPNGSLPKYAPGSRAAIFIFFPGRHNDQHLWVIMAQLLGLCMQISTSCHNKVYLSASIFFSGLFQVTSCRLEHGCFMTCHSEDKKFAWHFLIQWNESTV